MAVGANQKRISEVMEKTEARKIHELADSQTGSLLEKATNGIYSISIENIPAKEEVVVEIEYFTELKPASDGELAFIFPTQISRKHQGALQKTAKDLIAHQTTNDAYMTILPNSFYFNITWESSAKINRIYSLTDEIEVSSVHEQKVNIQASSVSIHRDFNLFVATESQAATASYLNVDQGEGYITIADHFKKGNTRAATAAEKEFIIVLDISKSMSTETMVGWSGVTQPTPKIDFGKQAVASLLKALPPKSSFNIVTFGDDCKAVFSHSISSTEANKNMELRKIAHESGHVAGKELFTCLFDILNENGMKTDFAEELSTRFNETRMDAADRRGNCRSKQNRCSHHRRGRDQF
jgi:hypothetical protein